MIVKINPVASWSRRDTWEYLRANDLPHNPLYDLGYASIGCAPCTRVQFSGEPERAGRWAGKAKWECGIHAGEAAKQDVVGLGEGVVPLGEDVVPLGEAGVIRLDEP
jgi:3'-phosphoadenosine 5'-phosphosulfate sulfotransferase (PAPS reductase)/FAD synthetase